MTTLLLPERDVRRLVELLRATGVEDDEDLAALIEEEVRGQ